MRREREKLYEKEDGKREEGERQTERQRER